MLSIIALIGPQGCGKSTVATKLAQTQQSQIISFADPIRNMLAALNDKPISGSSLKFIDKNAPLDWLGGKSYRFASQQLGTEYGRNTLNPKIWVNHLEKRLSEKMLNIVDDCRMENEYQMLKSHNAIFIKLDRAGIPKQSDSHSSEHFWSQIPSISISNEDLDECIKSIVDLKFLHHQQLYNSYIK